MELDGVTPFMDLLENPFSLFLDLDMVLFSLTLKLAQIIPWLSLKISRSLDGEETSLDNLDLEARR